LIRIQEIKPARNLSLEDAKPEIAQKLYHQEHAKMLAMDTAEALRSACAEAKDKTIEEVLDDEQFAGLPIQHRKTGLFPASTPRFLIPTAGPIEDLFVDGFKLTEDAPVAGKVYEEPRTGRLVVARLIEKQTLGEEGVTKEEIDKARDDLAMERSVGFFQAWYESLLAKAKADEKIEYSQDFQSYLAALQTAQEGRESKAAKKAARNL